MVFKSKNPYLQTQEDIEYYIKRMARHYKEDEEQIRKEVKERPEILEGYVEYLANDFDETPRNHRHYGSTYYE